MSLPTDTRGEAAGSGFFKSEQGQTEFLIVDGVVPGYQAWMLDGSCKKQEQVFEEPIEGIRLREVKDKAGNVVGSEPEKQQFYWALALYNFKTKAFEIAQFTQKGIREELLALQNNPKWGDPTGNYTITLDKSGEGFKTEYKLMPNPNDDASKAQIAEIMAQYKAAPIDVRATLFGATAPTTEVATEEEAPAEVEAPAEEVAQEAPVATPEDAPAAETTA